MLATLTDLTALLAETQSARRRETVCTLTPELSARMSDAALRETVLTGLPMAQAVQLRIQRSRGSGASLALRFRYREGVHILAHAQGEPVALSARETGALSAARAIAEAASGKADEEARFRYVYRWLCENVRYVHTAPGCKGYEQLVGASGALLNREANCQGFADALYLLCGLCGIPAAYRCGRGERQLHVWNSVCIGGVWREADASRGARGLED